MDFANTLVFTEPVLLEHNSLIPDWQTVLTESHRQGALVFLRLEVGSSRLKGFELDSNWSKFDGVEIDFNTEAGAKEQGLSKVIDSIGCLNVPICLRISCLTDDISWILNDTRIVDNPGVSLIHIVDVHPLMLSPGSNIYEPLLALFTRFPTILRNDDTEMLRLRHDANDLSQAKITRLRNLTIPTISHEYSPSIRSGVASPQGTKTPLILNHTDPGRYLAPMAEPIRRRPSPFKVRTTGFTDIENVVPSNKSEFAPQELIFWGKIIIAATWTFALAFIALVMGLPDRYLYSQVESSTYAEYEDITGYPIRDYYPALAILILTVVSWLWCLFSWMGMKFFRHARGSGRSTST